MLWLTAFLDLAPTDFDRGVAFWQGVTGYAVSEPRGDAAEFATLVPPEGDPFLRVQRLGGGPGRIHLDVHVPDPEAAAEDVAPLGATVVSRPDAGYVVMASPGGLAFCLVRHRAAVPPPPTTWPAGHGSLVDQVCLDIPAGRYDGECAFWQRLTGWELVDVPEHDEFRRLLRPAGQPLRLLLQRLGEDGGRVRAHLDLATTDRTAETGRHAALGARVLDTRPGWTVLADPTGAAYCITARAPETPVPGAGADSWRPPMTSPERRRVPLVAGETEMLLAWLDFHRDTLRLKTDGLSGDQLAVPLPPSTMTLGGLLKHMARAEDNWFSVVLLGNEETEPWRDVDWDDDPDWEWHTGAQDSPEELRRLFDEACAASDRILAEVLADDGLERLSVRESHREGGGRFSLRWILTHMIEEYARHNGHADLLRESVDGATGA